MDSSVSVRFGQRAAFDLAAIDGDSPGILSGLADGEGSSETVTFRIPEGAEIKHFRDGARVALDVVLSPERPDELQVAAAPIPDVVIEAVPGVVPPKDPEAVGRPTRIAPARPVPVETEIAATQSTVGKTDGPVKPVVPVHFEPKGEGGVLRFEGGEPLAKAVFSRGGWTWVVVDQPGAVNLPRLRVEAEGVLANLELLPNEVATVLRFKLAADVNPVAVADGEDWLVDFAERPAHPLVELDGDVRSESGRTRFVSHCASRALKR